MEKPILLVREEFTRNLLDLINKSKLPLILIEPILQKLLEDTRIGLQKQYKKEKEDYEKYLNEIKENVETTSE